MSNARERILARLRRARPEPSGPPASSAPLDREWRARQPPLGDLAERFVREQEAVGSQVRRCSGWEALNDLVAPWLIEHQVSSIMTGTEPRLDSLRGSLEATGRFTLSQYNQEIEQQKEEVFSVDCGITTSQGAIAETGSVIIIPTPAEPRLLSLAVPLHLVLVEVSRIHPTLADFIAEGGYRETVPTNLVLVSGASRTADIELTLAMGVHGPKVFLVALIG